MLQVLWERGFLDVSMNVKEMLKYYTLDGKKTNDGSTIENTSLKEMIKNLPDFVNELTLLQHRAHQLGVRIMCSPKFHPEIAGEGIEFCWALAKNRYRQQSLKKKNSKHKFKELVNACVHSSVLTKRSVRLFGKCMRRYMCAYLSLEVQKNHNAQQIQSVEGFNIHQPEMSCGLVEKIVSKYQQEKKTHRNIADQDTSFISQVQERMKYVSVSN